MNQVTGEKLVNRAQYCKQCQYEKDSEWDENSPCYDCMFDVVNQYSEKPTGFKEKESKSGN